MKAFFLATQKRAKHINVKIRDLKQLLIVFMLRLMSSESYQKAMIKIFPFMKRPLKEKRKRKKMRKQKGIQKRSN